MLPSADTLERIGLAGRARARRLSAQALNDALGDERKKALEALLADELTAAVSEDGRSIDQAREVLFLKEPADRF